MNLTEVALHAQEHHQGAGRNPPDEEPQDHRHRTARRQFPPAEFWKKYDAGEFGKPAVAKLAYHDPAFQAWVKAAAALPAEKQIEAVSKKLMELNPGFDGKVTGAMEQARPRSRRAWSRSLGFSPTT